KKRKNKKKEKKNMPKMCTVATHAERGAPGQRLCRTIRHVVLRSLFCYLTRLPAIRIRRMAIASFSQIYRIQ
ncbi:hypothetical protein, partial [Klebsiella pneumoniae]|uniref:hypothetical protein n=1 Tax=Klebsiella pneumoniae TaxID=573 RepID=UPI001C12A5B1